LEEIKSLVGSGARERKASGLIPSSLSPIKHPLVNPLWKPVGKEPGNTVCRRSAGTGSEGKKT